MLLIGILFGAMIHSVTALVLTIEKCFIEYNIKQSFIYGETSVVTLYVSAPNKI